MEKEKLEPKLLTEKSEDYKEWEVWTEGFMVTGNTEVAQFHGKFKGRNFREAVLQYKNSVSKETQSFIDLDRMSYWGCRFFDNERDARKSFG